jgi:hypothetical protein
MDGIPAPASRSAQIAVCLAVHRPDPVLLERQLASLDAQQEVTWTLVRHDDAEGVGSYAAFEQALALAPAGVAFVAPCDQDDVWHPDKLRVLRDALAGGALLAYGDQRIVRTDGSVVSPTYWGTRQNGCDALEELLLTNTVSGAASLVRHEVLDIALPFPPALLGSFHDHWLAVCALALGEIAYVDRPVMDYVQHDGNVVGHAERPRRADRTGDGAWRDRARRDHERHVQRPALFARTLLERAGPRMTPAKRQAAERVAAGDARLGALLAGAVREQLHPQRTLEARRRALRAALGRRLRAF